MGVNRYVASRSFAVLVYKTPTVRVLRLHKTSCFIFYLLENFVRSELVTLIRIDKKYFEGVGSFLGYGRARGGQSRKVKVVSRYQWLLCWAQRIASRATVEVLHEALESASHYVVIVLCKSSHKVF